MEAVVYSAPPRVLAVIDEKLVNEKTVNEKTVNKNGPMSTEEDMVEATCLLRSSK